ncbi:HNH endonuclease [Nocardioides marmoribigeumensis]|uniref:HNH nuclease domain-containing protein n=1 Tax=Nocardioides marmoribigeumensis TaxID=433649 RepID=A0ABU2C1P0_9ACTN|nr:DUF222 domain-containing protein [Nocardioides marmoribigeumensis]MDR7364589.1 hypothetical protein [Nocardioides marmoribigeumensis]
MPLRTESEWTAQMRGHADALVLLDPDASDQDLVDQLRVLEETKAKVAAAQVAITTRLAASQERAQRDAGVRPDKVGLGIGSQVALAKRESTFRGGAFVQFSKVLLRELPHTYAVLAAGRTTEWRARIVVKETVWLSPEHRAQLDAEIAPLLEGWGDRRVEQEVRTRAYRLDPRGFVERGATAAKDRRVTVRPAPDVMSNLSAHLPVAQGVAAYAALRKHADSLRAGGDERSVGQIMADTLVERITGQATAEAVPITVGLVMSDQTMFNAGDHSDEPAQVEGYGPIPADLARRLLLAADADADLWVQRLFTRPTTGELAAIDSKARFFRGALRKLVVARDRWCRTPWCEAPIRHGDHVVDRADGGPTSSRNGEGLCEACNYVYNAPGWSAAAAATGAHLVVTTTPTGHRYRSLPPDPPRTSDPPERVRRPIDYRFEGCVVDVA